MAKFGFYGFNNGVCQKPSTDKARTKIHKSITYSFRKFSIFKFFSKAYIYSFIAILRNARMSRS